MSLARRLWNHPVCRPWGGGCRAPGTEEATGEATRCPGSTRRQAGPCSWAPITQHHPQLLAFVGSSPKLGLRASRALAGAFGYEKPGARVASVVRRLLCHNSWSRGRETAATDNLVMCQGTFGFSCNPDWLGQARARTQKAPCTHWCLSQGSGVFKW